MRSSLPVVCLLALFGAIPAIAQQDEWRIQMVEAEKQVGIGNYTRAADFYSQAVHASESRPDRAGLAKALDGLATMYGELGRFPDAERLYRRALAASAGPGMVNDLNRATIAANLGAFYLDQGMNSKAGPLVREAIAAYEATLPADDARLAAARDCLALLMMEMRRYAEAETLVNQALAAFRGHPELAGTEAVALNNLGVLRQHQGRLEEAAAIFHQAISELETNLGDDHPLLLRTLNNLGMVQTEAGHRDSAEAAFLRGLEIAEKRFGPDNFLYGRMLLNYSYCERKFGKKKEAKAMASRAKAILTASARANGTGLTVDASSFQPRR